jgi:hypothetical protein
LEEDFRLLEIRFLLLHLADLGLGQQVSQELKIDREDLYQLAMIEAECRAMAQPKGDADGE